MLVPLADTMRQATLVREDLPIDDMLVTAVRYRPDLEAVRALLAAAEAGKGAAVWGGLGPQAQAMGVLAPRPPTGSVVDTMYRQPIYTTTGGFNWSAATFGRIKSATAILREPRSASLRSCQSPYVAARPSHDRQRA